MLCGTLVGRSRCVIYKHIPHLVALRRTLRTPSPEDWPLVGTAHEAAPAMYGTLLSGGGSKPSSPAGNQVRGWAVK